MSRVVYWRETSEQRTVIVRPEATIIARKGEVVVVFVAESANEALRALAALEGKDEH